MELFLEEWEDKDVRNWLEVIAENSTSEQYRTLKDRYEHWDMQLFLANENEKVVDLEGCPFEPSLVPDELAEIVCQIYLKAKNIAN